MNRIEFAMEHMSDNIIHQIGSDGSDEEYRFQELSASTDFNKIAKKLIRAQPIWYDGNKIWWLWNNKRSCWTMIDDIDMKNTINDFSRVPTADPRVLQSMLEALKMGGRRNKPKSPKDNWIQFGDTIVDVETKEEFQATSKYFFTNPIPWSLGDSEDTPTIDMLLEDWVSPDYRHTLLQIIAYCTITSYPIHRIFYLVGTGSNGKTCFQNMICRFVGDKNVASTDLDALQKSRFEAARLYRKLVCLIGETNFNRFEKTSIIKRLTGDDMMPMELKNKTPFEARNYAKILIATNELPPTADKTPGFYRRCHIVKFMTEFDEKRDVLSEIPNKEYRNLARKVIPILFELLQNREFHNDELVEEREKTYQALSDPFDEFWSENIVLNHEKHITKIEFKKRIDSWYMQNKIRCLTNSMIAVSMRNKNVESRRVSIEDKVEKNRPRAWLGIS